MSSSVVESVAAAASASDFANTLANALLTVSGQTVTVTNVGSVTYTVNGVTTVYGASSSDDGLSGGAIAGIVIGSVLGFSIIAALVFFLVFKNPKHEPTDDKTVIYHDQETNQES